MPRGAIPEYPPILRGTVEEQMIQLREYIIRNIDTLLSGIAGGGSGGALTLTNGNIYIDQTGTGDLITLQEWINNNVHIDGNNVYITNVEGDQVTFQEFITNQGDVITVTVDGDTTTTLQEFITNASEYITVNVDGDTITLQEYITNLAEQLDDFEVKSNKVQTVNSSSTREQYPSAKCLWDMIGDVALSLAILGGDDISAEIIADQIDRLMDDRDDIRQALIDKGITGAGDHGFHDFADDILAIVQNLDLQTKSITISTNGTQTVTPDTGKDGMSSVEIITNVPQGITPSGTINITNNGTHDVTNYASANVQVPSAAPNLQSKNATPSGSAQTIVPDSGYDGLSSVIIAAAPLETKNVTPTASQQIITPSSGQYGMSQVTVAGDANLIAGNIKKDIVIFGVTGTYEGGGGGSTVNGSLIEVTCSSNIDEVTATVNGNTYTATMNTSTHKAYLTIPYTDTTAARTCVVKGFRNGTQLTSTQVSMTAGIGYYTALLETSQRLYYYGTWYGVTGQTWTKSVNTSTITDSASGLSLYCPNGNYDHRFTMSPNIDTRGYTKFRIKGTITGGVSGSASQQTTGMSTVRIGNQIVNLPNNTSGTQSFEITSERYEESSTDATLVINISVPMGYAPATVLIQEIEFV